MKRDWFFQAVGVYVVGVVIGWCGIALLATNLP